MIIFNQVTQERVSENKRIENQIPSLRILKSRVWSIQSRDNRKSMETPLYHSYQQFLKSEKLFSLFGLLHSDFGPYHLSKIINDLHIPKLKTKVSAIILTDFSDTMTLPFRIIYLWLTFCNLALIDLLESSPSEFPLPLPSLKHWDASDSLLGPFTPLSLQGNLIALSSTFYWHRLE